MTPVSTRPRPLTDTETVRYANNRNQVLCIVRGKIFATISPYYLRSWDSTPQGYAVQIGQSNARTFNGSIDRAMAYAEDKAREVIAA